MLKMMVGCCCVTFMIYICMIKTHTMFSAIFITSSVALIVWAWKSESKTTKNH